jgi:HK97 gp10 family phage protein
MAKPFTKNGVSAINGRCVAQLKSLQNVGHVAALPLAQFAAKRAREYAHVITGYMRDHTVAKKTGEGKAEVVSTAPYAAYEEFGTRFREPHPFIRPAIADVAMDGPQMSAREINAEIRKRVQSA